MDKDELIKKAKDLKLPKGKYVVFGGAPLCVRGIRKSHDLDVLVAPEVFEEFYKKDGWKKKFAESGSEAFVKDNVEIFKDWFGMDTKKIIDDAEIVNGVTFASLEDVLLWKRRDNREKDLEDIELIEKYLAEEKK